jgi:hypothetical protein
MTNRLYTGKPQPCHVCNKEFAPGEKSKAIQTSSGFRRVHVHCAAKHRTDDMLRKRASR